MITRANDDSGLSGLKRSPSPGSSCQLIGELLDTSKLYWAHYKKRVTVFTEYHGTFATMKPVTKRETVGTLR